MTSLAQLLGLPDVGGALSGAITPGYLAVISPLATQYTNALNENIGPVTNGLSAGQSDPGVQTALTTSEESPTALLDSRTDIDEDAVTSAQDQAKQARAELDASIKAANAKTRAAVTKAGADVEKSVKKTAATLNKIAKDGQEQIKKTVAGVQKTVHDAAKNAGDSTDQKTSKDKPSDG